MRLSMLVLMCLLMIFSCGGTYKTQPVSLEGSGACPDTDVWVYIKHPGGFWESPAVVIVHIPKHSLTGDFNNCPAADTKAVGPGRWLREYVGYRVVTIKKGLLNDPKNYTTRPPRKFKIPADNMETWHAEANVSKTMD